jgi:phosphotransferase system enzyme I (PtsI)
MQGRPVTIRTFDLGADKEPHSFEGLARVAPNPALGLRAVRFCLAEPRLFQTQLRAMLRATHYGNIRILIPMLASVSEIDQTLVMIERAKETLREQSIPFNADTKVGGMIEIPAAALAIGAFLRKLDFLSLGTNDLIQYTLAVDRADDAVSHLYDPLHPAVLRLIGLAIGAATKANVPIAMCGEMAGEQRLTRLFLGMGLREFSMHPSQLLAVKQRVLQTNVAAGATLVERIRRVDEPEKLEALLDRLNA